MKNADKKALVDWLDERLKIVTTLNRPEDELFYRGACSSIEKMGYWIITEDDGHHLIGKK